MSDFAADRKLIKDWRFLLLHCRYKQGKDILRNQEAEEARTSHHGDLVLIQQTGQGGESA